MSKIFKHSSGCFDDSKSIIMGILNITPDSFYDGGMYFSQDKAVNHAMEMIDGGADIIDIGAMSTRPGSEKITFEQEIERLSPVLQKVSNFAVVSVDTVYPETAEYAMNNGASIINDVSGCFNPDMAEVVKKYSAGWIITHTMNVDAGSECDYPNGVTQSVKEFFDGMLLKIQDFGIDGDYICLDPGFGFAKNTEQNLTLLNSINILSNYKQFLLTALSQKRFIRSVSSDPSIGTVAADVIAVMNGSNGVRVHDVKGAKASLSVCDALRRISNG